MLDKIRDWLDSNPNGRKVLVVGAVAMMLMMVGVMLALNSEGHGGGDDPGPQVTMDPGLSGETTGGDTGGDRPPVQPGGDGPARPRTVWINQANVPATAQPGLNVQPVKMLALWEEVVHVQEDTDSHWDQIRLRDGQEVWVQSKFIEFAKPSNLDQPVPAELCVMAFYQAVARKDYAAGYAYLSAPWKAELSFDQFVDGYTRTLSLRTEIARVVELGDERYQVDVSMVADELGRDVPYIGSYVVVKEGDQWDMASGRLLRAGGPRDVVAPGPDGVVTAPDGTEIVPEGQQPPPPPPAESVPQGPATLPPLPPTDPGTPAPADPGV